MNKFRFGKWTGISRDPCTMEKAMILLEGLKREEAFRIKEDRLIFKFCIDNRWYFAKKNIPKRLKEILKETVRPQSKIEYNSGVLLESLGIPVVNMIGWARKKTVSVLVTEQPRDSTITAIDLWNNRVLLYEEERCRFLAALSEFIRLFVFARLVHPDLHLGNLLATEGGDSVKLIVVDPFGIRLFRGKNYNLFKGGLAPLLYGLQWHTSRAQRIELFLKSCLIDDGANFDTTWEKIIKFVVDHQLSEWRGGRRRKFLTRNTRFTEKANDSDGVVLFIRKGVDGKPLLSRDQLNCASLIKEETKKAKVKWLFSLYLQCLEIDHLKAIAWEKKRHGTDIIFLENEREFFPYKESEYLKDFLCRCNAAGIKINNPSEEILFRGNMPCLKNCNPDYWGKKKL